MSRKRMLALALFAALAAGAAHAAFYPERLRLLAAARFAELETLMERETAGDPQPKSARLMFLCAAYSKLKRYDKLFPCLDRLDGNIARGDIAMNDVEEMARDSPFLTGLARMGAGMAGADQALAGTVVPFAHLMRSEAWNELRDYPKAIAAARAANEAIPVGWSIERSIRITALTTLGLAEGFGGHRDRAIRVAEELERIDTSYPHTLLAADKMLGIARIYASIGDFAKAGAALKVDTSSGLGALAIGLANSVAGMDEGDSLFSYVELPKEFLLYKTQFENGETAPAKAGFDKLLKDPRTRGNGEIWWLLLFDRGRIAAAEGDLAGAVDMWRQAVEIIERQRASINTEANKIGFVGDKQAVYRQLIDGLYSAGRHAEAFEYLERSKSRALVDLLASKKDFAVAGADEAKIRDLLSQAEQGEIAGLAQNAAPRQRTLGVSPQAAALREQAPELAALVTVGALPVGEIRSRLRVDETLVEYYYDDRHLYAFVLDSDGLAVVRSNAAGLEDQLRAWRVALENPEGDAHLGPAQALHARLVAPIQDRLSRPRLTLVAHGALHYVPLAALHDGREYLIDRHAIRLLPSASVMKFLRSGEGRYAAGVLALGNPDLGDPRLDLQFAQQEAAAIVRMVPDSRAFLRKEANEAALRQFGTGFRYLHFATHGEFKADAPLDSALYLAGGEGSDGRLTVGKLYSMRLDSDLVTLSACETGLGRIASGDDVVGLTRGFLYAGAATVVASLWKVDDQATSDLMRAFYANLARTGKLDALREAQRELRRSHPQPFFWAPFQLVGTPDGGQYTPAPPPAPPTPPLAATAVKGKPAGAKARGPQPAPSRPKPARPTRSPRLRTNRHHPRARQGGRGECSLPAPGRP